MKEITYINTMIIKGLKDMVNECDDFVQELQKDEEMQYAEV